VLQEREIEPLGSNKVAEVDVRVIAATSCNLKSLVDEGRFRADLYYRLNVLPVRLPSLRERLSDLEALCESLLESIAQRTGMPQREMTSSAISALATHEWRGNVRELRNVLEQATMHTDNIRLTSEDFLTILPSARRDSPHPTLRPLPQLIAELEFTSIRSALEATQGNKVSAAKLLGISRATLYGKLAELKRMSN
jgi:transcriptional regulator with PAS, ATPase and Fis domain